MNNMEKAPMDIGAGWFIVRHDFRKSLMVTIIPPAVGVTLSIAALLKVIEFIHHPDRQRVPWFDLASIGSELFLGLWLISGALPEAARRVAIGCFSVFACYTFYEAFAGKTDCGCFGQVKVNPWFTVVLDVAVVLALVFLAKPAAKSAVAPSRWASRKWPVVAALGIGLAAGIASAMLRPKLAVAANGLATADSGKLVILEPHKWLRHRLPVLAHIVSQRGNRPLGQQFATGNWIIVLYHAGCGECQQTIPVYEQLAQRETLPGKRAHVAFIRVPSGAGISTRGLFHSDLPLHATLDAGHQWFATTPIVVELRDGIVHRVATGRSAMNPQWMNIAAYHRETAGGTDAVQWPNGQ